MKNLTTLAQSLPALGALFVFAAPTLAQKPTPPPTQRQRRPATNGMNLTPAQKTKMQALMTNARAKSLAIRDNATLTPAQKRTQMQAISKEYMAKINAILTPAQLAKMKANRAAYQKNRMSR